MRKQTALGQPPFSICSTTAIRRRTTAGLHAFHAAELPYVFGTFDRTPPLLAEDSATPAETTLSDAMVDYWTSFARDGRAERGERQPHWPAYGTTRAYMTFADTPQLARRPHAGHVSSCTKQVVCRRRAHGGVSWNWNVGVTAPPLPPARRRADDRRRHTSVSADAGPKFSTMQRSGIPERKWSPPATAAAPSRRLCSCSAARLRVSRVLRDFGVVLGDRVATLAWNSQAHVEAWYAIMGMGAVCHTLNPRLTATQLAGCSASRTRKILIVSADLLPLAMQSCRGRTAISSASW